MAKSKSSKGKNQKTKIHEAIVKQMLTLATSGFGLVAALAWNEAIKELVNNYIKPYTSRGSGLVSMIIYATVVTILAVLVTYNLGKILKKEDKK